MSTASLFNQGDAYFNKINNWDEFHESVGIGIRQDYYF